MKGPNDEIGLDMIDAIKETFIPTIVRRMQLIGARKRIMKTDDLERTTTFRFEEVTTVT